MSITFYSYLYYSYLYYRYSYYSYLYYRCLYYHYSYYRYSHCIPTIPEDLLMDIRHSVQHALLKFMLPGRLFMLILSHKENSRRE